jgi:V8-like Glu-specific endopeptidase
LISCPKINMKFAIVLLFAALSSALPAEEYPIYTDVFYNHKVLEVPEEAIEYDYFGDVEKFEPSIINGENALPGQWPHVARMSFVRTSGAGSWCSASLIHVQYVLCASHCINSNPQTIATVSFLLGTVNRNVPGVNINAAEFWWHPQSSTLGDDISLFRLVAPVTVTNLVAPIRIVDRSHVGLSFAGSNITVAGWGLDNTGGAAIVLQWANFRVLASNQCAAGFTPTEMCYVAHPGSTASTQGGDSGSGVFIPNYFSPGQHLQIGIHAGRRTSGGNWMSACRVNMFLDWINARTSFEV